MQTRRLASSFECLISSLVQSPGKLLSCKVARNSGSMHDFKVQVTCTLAVDVLCMLYTVFAAR